MPRKALVTLEVDVLNSKGRTVLYRIPSSVDCYALEFYADHPAIKKVEEIAPPWTPGDIVEWPFPGTVGVRGIREWRITGGANTYSDSWIDDAVSAGVAKIVRRKEES